MEASSSNLGHYEGTTFATRRGALSAFGPRQAAASRKPPSWRTKTPASRASRKKHGAPTARYMKAHKISRINELPPQKGIFRVISCRALGPCSCPADGAPAGAAVVARLARHRLRPCRGDTAECCRKATRRSQGLWSRASANTVSPLHVLHVLHGYSLPPTRPTRSTRLNTLLQLTKD